MPNYDAWGRAGAPTNQELERLRSAEAVRAAEATEHYERIKRLRQFVHDQWMRIPPVVKARPGSYDRGYQNGMADILRGMQAQLDRSTPETEARHTLDCAMVKHPNCTQCDCGSFIDTHRDPSRPSDGQKVIRDAASASVRIPVEDPTCDGSGHPAGLQPGVPPREANAGGVTSNAGAPGRGIPDTETAEVTPAFAAEFEREIVRKVLRDVEALTEGRTDPFWAGVSTAVEEATHRLDEVWGGLPTQETSGEQYG